MVTIITDSPAHLGTDVSRTPVASSPATTVLALPGFCIS